MKVLTVHFVLRTLQTSLVKKENQALDMIDDSKGQIDLETIYKIYQWVFGKKIMETFIRVCL